MNPRILAIDKALQEMKTLEQWLIDERKQLMLAEVEDGTDNPRQTP